MFDPNNPFRKGDSLVDAVRSILSGKPIEEKKMDPVDQKALKGKHSDRKDKDIDNDGDVDDSDEYLHKRRQAISKAMKESEDEMDDEDDDEEEENGKKKKLSGKKDEVDTKPSMDDQKMASEMSDAQMKKREEIVKSMKKKMPDFKKKYGERAKDVMYATATKMAMKEGFELTEEDFEELDEAKMSASQIAALKKAYEPMRGKKISMDSGNKLRSIMDKVNDDKQALIQLVKADIPFVSSLAVTRLISKHGMKGAEINKLKEEVELDEAKFSAKEIKMAIGIASDPRYKGGKMTGAAQAIDKIKPGLSDHPQVRAVLQRVNEAPEDMEPASPDEGSMALDQLKFMSYAANKMMEHIQGGGEFPEWMQNKLSGTFEKMKSLYANIEHGEMKEGVEPIQYEATYSYKAATFNGNVVKGTGSTKEAARKDAEKKAKALGSTIRKRLPEEVDLEGK